jgi:hypothetical protein
MSDTPSRRERQEQQDAFSAHGARAFGDGSALLVMPIDRLEVLDVTTPETVTLTLHHLRL